MPRPKKAIPDLYFLESKQTWCVNLAGKRKSFGRDKAEAERAYQRLIGEYLVSGGAASSSGKIGTVAELAAAYTKHAQELFAPAPGKSRGAMDRVNMAMKALCDPYGPEPIEAFGPLALLAVIKGMVERGWARNTCNGARAAIISAFKWAKDLELIPDRAYERIRDTGYIRKGSSNDRPRVRPVDDDTVLLTAACASPTVAAMIRLQELTGMRSGELCALRPMHVLEISADLWEYHVPPEANKTEHAGYERIVDMGPMAMAILRPYMVCATDEFCFSPRRAEEQRRDGLRQGRKTPMKPSQAKRDQERSARRVAFREHYTTATYRQAVARAAKEAGVKPWHPHQLRHTRGTKLRAEFDLETARTALGHHSAAITEMYAERDRNKSREAARKVG